MKIELSEHEVKLLRVILKNSENHMARLMFKHRETELEELFIQARDYCDELFKRLEGTD